MILGVLRETFWTLCMTCCRARCQLVLLNSDKYEYTISDSNKILCCSYSGDPQGVCAMDASTKCLANPKSAILSTAKFDDSLSSTLAGFRSR